MKNLTSNIIKLGFLSTLAFSCQVNAATPTNKKPGNSDLSPPDNVLVHRLRTIDLACENHLVLDARLVQGPDKAGPLDQEKLLLSAVRDKPFPKQPTESLAWMQQGMAIHGFDGKLSDLRGPAQMAVLRIASLANNDYAIASQMAYGIHARQGLFVKPLSDFIGYLIMGLTEDSDQTPETNYTNETINQAVQYFGSMKPAVKGYAKWVVRAYAYDDVVAIDAATAGLCMSGPTKEDMSSLGKAIKLAQFDPKRNYNKPLVVSGLNLDSRGVNSSNSKAP